MYEELHLIYLSSIFAGWSDITKGFIQDSPQLYCGVSTGQTIGLDWAFDTKWKLVLDVVTLTRNKYIQKCEWVTFILKIGINNSHELLFKIKNQL